MKLKNKEDQSVDASVLLRRRNKMIMEGRGRDMYGRGRGGKREHDQVWEDMGVGEKGGGAGETWLRGSDVEGDTRDVQRIRK